MDVKSELLEKMAQKKMDVASLAQAMEFDAGILKLYLVQDDYPIPSRIIKKMEEVLAN
ncbi:hypothetical protein [Desulfosoma caldarium]|uniref:XRE family transcriptional regulator n=1 Tax=Desulfosoma caldarium TaxID=610254 RepID=A0A3N1UDM6_9BACT|nr:hypothetical protein [Desulfosoma caldarium]ROQ89522.1 hypothetical protein EDC27_3058 [Desulfosoma caldarium]